MKLKFVYLIGVVLAFVLGAMLQSQLQQQGSSTLRELEINRQQMSLDAELMAGSVEPNTKSNTQSNNEPNTEPLAINWHHLVEDLLRLPNLFQQQQQAYWYAKQANQAQLEQVLDSLLSLELANTSTLLSSFYQRYVLLDPAAAIEHFNGNINSESSLYSDLLGNMFREWFYVDVVSAVAYIEQQLPLTQAELVIRLLLVDHKFAEHPQLQQLAQRYSDITHMYLIRSLVRQQKFAQSMTRLLEFSNSSDRTDVIKQVLKRWVAQQPQAAVNYLQQLTDQSSQLRLLHFAVTEWANQDMEAALQAVLLMADNENLFFPLLSAGVELNPTRALDLVESYNDKLPSYTASQIIQRWAELNAQAAAEYAFSKGNRFSAEFDKIAAHYARQSPELVYQWLEQQGLNNDRKVLDSVANTLVTEDLQLAEQVFDSLAPGPARSGLLVSISQRRSRINMADSYQWLLQYQDDARFARQQARLLYNWSRQQPEQALPAIMTLADSVNRTRYVSLAVTNWYEKEPELAVRWALNLQSGSVRDRALTRLIQSVSYSDLTTAIELAEQISDPQRRKRTLDYLKQTR